MKQGNHILQKCIEHLQALPGIQASLISSHALVKGIDGIINITSPLKSVDYAYTIQPDVNGKIVELVIAYLKRHEEKVGQKLLLVSRYLPNNAIEHLLDENIEFIDSAGNTYLNSAATYVLIRGKHRPKEKISPILQITPNTLKLIYMLLKNPKILEVPSKELAIATGLTTRTVSQTLKNLYQLGYLQRQRNGSYRIADYTKLLERWEIGYTETLRPKLLVGTFTSVGERKFSQVADNIISLAKEQNFLIGGELGAAIVTSYLNPIGATLHVLDNYRLIAAKLRLKPSPHGEITFLQQFGVNNALDNKQEEFIADPLLIHTELMLSNDKRLMETAARIFDLYIEAVATSA